MELREQEVPFEQAPRVGHDCCRHLDEERCGLVAVDDRLAVKV
jgi:hypothetical protein